MKKIHNNNDLQEAMFIQYEDFSDEDILLGLSGGINSAAVACWLSTWPEHLKPRSIHLYYAHFEEHSPDTFAFVKECIRFCKRNFKNVFVKITRNSIIRFFEEQNMIPHPTVSPCTRILKIMPMHEYMIQHGIKIDLVGYVRDEIRRVKNMAKKTKKDIDGCSIQMDDVKKLFPISDKTNEWCFAIVKRLIGWYPAIYTLRWNDKKFMQFMLDNLSRVDIDTEKTILKKLGTRQRVFGHNNCLPCKNMQKDDYLAVEYFFNWFYINSVNLAKKLKKHWGRVLKESKGNKTIEDLFFHLDFGRTEAETNYEKQSCGVCAFS